MIRRTWVGLVILTSVINDVHSSLQRDYERLFLVKKGSSIWMKIKLDAKDGVYKPAPFGPMYSKREKQILYSKVRMSTQPK